MGKISFFVDSDLHFGKSVGSTGKPIIFQATKKDHVEKITSYIREHPGEIQAVICPGDLTDDGWNGFLECLTKLPDQLTPLKKQFVEPIEKTGVKVYLCAGNHDNAVPSPFDYFYLPVYNYVIEKHGSLEYDFHMGNLHFICMSVYPRKSKTNYLVSKINNAIKNNRKIIIYFHYNLDGIDSEWFKRNQKEDYNAFFETIRPYHEHIMALLVGHRHESYDLTHSHYLDNQGLTFRVISGAGSKLTLCTYDEETEELAVKFI